MHFSKAGIILLTDRYADCVAFYGEALKLPLMFKLDRADSTLACFDMGGAYLMVEPGLPEAGGDGHSPVKLRFNVGDVEAAAEALRKQGIETAVQRHDWGTTAEFADPDGNRCALRSEQGFGE
jgi:lactoylglutathione lyase